jgi:phosphatidylglycerol:prolipoprotein diacylglycerol transferase
MCPILFKLGPLSVKSYGVMLVVAFIAGIVLALKRAKNAGIKPEKIIDLALIVLISSLVGSRFFYVVYHLDEFQGHFWDTVNPFQSSGEIGIGGLSMMDGVVLSVVVGIAYLIFMRMPIWKVADSVAPSFPLGLAFARIGCFLNGCCPGKVTDSFLGVTFPADSFAGYFFPGVKLLPTQLFSSVAGFLIFLLLLFLERYKTFEGFTFWLMLIFYSAWRFTVDFFRYYEESMVFVRFGNIEISQNQILSLLIFLISISIWLYLRAKNKSRESLSLK